MAPRANNGFFGVPLCIGRRQFPVAPSQSYLLIISSPLIKNPTPSSLMVLAFPHHVWHGEELASIALSLDTDPKNNTKFRSMSTLIWTIYVPCKCIDQTYRNQQRYVHVRRKQLSMHRSTLAVEEIRIWKLHGFKYVGHHDSGSKLGVTRDLICLGNNGSDSTKKATIMHVYLQKRLLYVCVCVCVLHVRHHCSRVLLVRQKTKANEFVHNHLVGFTNCVHGIVVSEVSPTRSSR